MRGPLTWLSLLLLWVGTGVAEGEPAAQRHPLVIDEAGWMPETERRRMDSVLLGLEARQGVRLGVLVSSRMPEEVLGLDSKIDALLWMRNDTLRFMTQKTAEGPAMASILRRHIQQIQGHGPWNLAVGLAANEIEERRSRNYFQRLVDSAMAMETERWVLHGLILLGLWWILHAWFSWAQRRANELRRSSRLPLIYSSDLIPMQFLGLSIFLVVFFLLDFFLYDEGRIDLSRELLTYAYALVGWVTVFTTWNLSSAEIHRNNEIASSQSALVFLTDAVRASNAASADAPMGAEASEPVIPQPGRAGDPPLQWDEQPAVCGPAPPPLVIPDLKPSPAAVQDPRRTLDV